MDNIIIKFVGMLITAFKLAAGSIVGRIMTALGLTFVNFTYALPQVKSWLFGYASGLDPQYQNIIAASGIDILMIMVISAIVARVGIRTITTSLTALQGLLGQEAGT